jgi:protein-disulfide isomerase-like protein with CxxC motif
MQSCRYRIHISALMLTLWLASLSSNGFPTISLAQRDTLKLVERQNAVKRTEGELAAV